MKKVIVLGATLVIGTAAATVESAPASAADLAGLQVEMSFASPQDAVPGLAPPDVADTAIYLDSDANPIVLTEKPGAVQPLALWCTPVSGRDNPHRSGPEVSGHGWWNKGSCSNDRAMVYNCLYEWYTDNSWRQKSCSSPQELRPGGGRGNRVTARSTCDDSLLTSWRNHVDVDVIGEIDTGEWPHNQANVTCRVY